MTDIDVHIRLRKCCRDKLADMDKRKAKARFKSGLIASSLLDMFGDKPVDKARALLPNGSSAKKPGGKKLQAVTLITCRTICQQHAQEHSSAGEKLEAAFWRELSASLNQEPATAPSAGPTDTSEAGGTIGMLTENDPTQVPAKLNEQEPPYVGLRRFAEARGFTVTSTTGGRHNPGSAHGAGRAIDVRTSDHSNEEINDFIREAQGAGIQVRDERTRPPGQAVWSGPHLHLSVPAGTSFP